MIKKLKPCPFCGGEAKEQWHPYTMRPDEPVVYGFECKKCFASTFPYFKTKEEAIQAWNKRASELELDVDGLQERFEGLSTLGLITFTQTMQPRDLAIAICSKYKEGKLFTKRRVV